MFKVWYDRNGSGRRRTLFRKQVHMFQEDWEIFEEIKELVRLERDGIVCHLIKPHEHYLGEYVIEASQEVSEVPPERLKEVATESYERIQSVRNEDGMGIRCWDLAFLPTVDFTPRADFAVPMTVERDFSNSYYELERFLCELDHNELEYYENLNPVTNLSKSLTPVTNLSKLLESGWVSLAFCSQIIQVIDSYIPWIGVVMSFTQPEPEIFASVFNFVASAGTLKVLFEGKVFGKDQRPYNQEDFEEWFDENSESRVDFQPARPAIGEETYVVTFVDWGFDPSNVLFDFGEAVHLENQSGVNSDRRGADIAQGITLPFYSKLSLGARISLEEIAVSYYKLKSHKWDEWYELFEGTSQEIRGAMSIILVHFGHGS